MRTLRRSAVVLWLLAPLLLWLSLYRPFTASKGRAARVPAAVAGFQAVREHELTGRERALLGTDDATWRTYTDPGGHELFVVVVFHEHNWKSVHPPHLCLRGSDMVLEGDGSVAGRAAGGEFHAGRILATSRGAGRRYVSHYVYGAAGLRTGSYARFVLHHLPRAIARLADAGYLLRVETWIDGDVAAADERCGRLLGALVPALEELLDG